MYVYTLSLDHGAFLPNHLLKRFKIWQGIPKSIFEYKNIAQIVSQYCKKKQKVISEGKNNHKQMWVRSCWDW